MLQNYSYGSHPVPSDAPEAVHQSSIQTSQNEVHEMEGSSGARQAIDIAASYNATPEIKEIERATSPPTAAELEATPTNLRSDETKQEFHTEPDLEAGAPPPYEQVPRAIAPDAAYQHTRDCNPDYGMGRKQPQRGCGPSTRRAKLVVIVSVVVVIAVVVAVAVGVTQSNRRKLGQYIGN